MPNLETEGSWERRRHHGKKFLTGRRKAVRKNRVPAAFREREQKGSVATQPKPPTNTEKDEGGKQIHNILGTKKLRA